MKESCRDLNHIRNILIDVLTPLVLLPLPLTGRYTVLPYSLVIALMLFTGSGVVLPNWFHQISLMVCNKKYLYVYMNPPRNPY